MFQLINFDRFSMMFRWINHSKAVPGVHTFEIVRAHTSLQISLKTSMAKSHMYIIFVCVLEYDRCSCLVPTCINVSVASTMEHGIQSLVIRNRCTCMVSKESGNS